MKLDGTIYKENASWFQELHLATLSAKAPL